MLSTDALSAFDTLDLFAKHHFALSIECMRSFCSAVIRPQHLTQSTCMLSIDVPFLLRSDVLSLSDTLGLYAVHVYGLSTECMTSYCRDMPSIFELLLCLHTVLILYALTKVVWHTHMCIGHMCKHWHLPYASI